MRTFLSCIFCFISVTCFSQTKLIAHKSHSGSNANFRLAINKNLFDIGQSNFGIVVKNVSTNVDTVLLKSKNTILLHRRSVVNQQGKLKTTRFITTVSKSQYPEFFNINSKEGLRVLIKKTYDIDTVGSTFIGFDKIFFKNKTKN